MVCLAFFAVNFLAAVFADAQQISRQFAAEPIISQAVRMQPLLRAAFYAFVANGCFNRISFSFPKCRLDVVRVNLLAVKSYSIRKYNRIAI